MGNKFKFSDMIPNAWFHKLKDMSKTRKKSSTNNNNSPKNIKKKPSLSPPIITTKTTLNNSNSNKPQYDQPPQEPPRKSSKRRSTSSSSSSRRRKPVFKPPHSRFVSSPSESENDEAFLRLSSSTADIIIDLETYQVKRAQNKIDHNNVSVDLPPILTKPINFDDTIFEATKDFRSRTKTMARNSGNSSSTSSTTKSLSVKIVKEERTVQRQKTTRHGSDCHQQKKCSSSSSTGAPGIRLRVNSPRLARKSVSSWSRNRRYLSESSAVVKSSVDPQTDFRDSMVEMIVENNIRASKDLEDLLACYLSLNSQEYHDVIVKAFEQIWFDMADIRI